MGALGMNQIGYGAMADRPGTRQGFGSLGTGVARPQTSRALATGVTRRVVQDKSFFMGELQQQVALVKAELARLADERMAIEHDNAHLAAFERRRDELTGSVRRMQDDLAVVNCVIEKQHLSVPLEQVLREADADERGAAQTDTRAKALATQAEQLQRDLDAVDAQIAPERARIETQLGELSPESQAKYRALKREDEQLDRQLRELAGVSDAQAKAQHFVDTFQQVWDESFGKLHATEKTISQLLEKLSVAVAGGAPTSEPIPARVEDSARAHAGSGGAASRLWAQYVTATNQLGQLEAAERTLRTQLQDARAKIRRFELANEGPSAHDTLSRQLVQLQPVRERLRTAAAALVQRENDLKATLQQSVTAPQLDSLRSKYALVQQANYNLEQGKSF